MRIDRLRDCCSKICIVLTLAAASCSTPERANAYTVRSDHPRIWLTPQILAQLRARAAAGSPRWQSLKNNCDSYMTSTSQYDVSVMNYGLAYQVTGNTAYADRAIVLMQGIVDHFGGKPLDRDSGYDVRGVLPVMAVGYDWCYDRLTPEQRTRFRTEMERWSDWVWPETNEARKDGWSVNNPRDNYYHGFMMTWMVGLSLYGDSPKAPGYVNMALKRWHEEARPSLDRDAAGGYLAEGTNYGTETTFRIFWYLGAHATATGEDLFNAPGFLWPRQTMRAKLYVTTPRMDRMFPGGDHSRESTASLSDYGRSSALGALNYLDRETAGIMKWWLDHITPDRMVWRWEQWQEFLWYRDDIEAIDYTRSLPTGYLSSGPGFMTSRSDWGRDATYVVMMCGPQLVGHQDLAQNDFMVFRGDWLASKARLNSHQGLFRDTEFHNTLTIGGLGQPETRWELPKDKPHVVHFADTPRYAYFAGEAADAYAFWRWPNVVPVLKTYLRQILFLKPNRLVVFDHVDAVDASQVKKWNLHTLQEPSLGTDSYQTTAAGFTLFGKTLLPKGATSEKTPLYLGTGGALNAWRISIAAPTGKNLDYFLNVLETAPSEQTVPTPVLPVKTGRSSLVGAQTGNQIVVFDAAPNPATSFSYQMNATAALEHFVLNQVPGKWYRITEQNAEGKTLQDQRVQASDQGVLTFPVTAPGQHTIVVAPADGPGSTPPTSSPAPTSPSTPPTPAPSAPPVTTPPAPAPPAAPTPTPAPTTPPAPPAPRPAPTTPPATSTPRPTPAPLPAPRPATPTPPAAPALPPAANGSASSPRPPSSVPSTRPPSTPAPAATRRFGQWKKKLLSARNRRLAQSARPVTTAKAHR
jgi:hypothetical protein